MPTRRRSGRRTPSQAAADERTAELAVALGRALRETRRSARLRQADIGARAALGRSTVAEMETGKGACMSLIVWTRAVRAAGGQLRAYVEGGSAANVPRDSVHMRHQELVVRTASRGGWHSLPEATRGPAPGMGGFADVLLQRAFEWALIEIWDWVPDGGSALRDWERKVHRVEALAIARLPADQPDARALGVGGCWVLRATKRNRELVRQHQALFSSRFPGSGERWLEALSSRRPMPAEPALLWVSVSGERLVPSRLRADAGGSAPPGTFRRGVGLRVASGDG